MKKHSKKRDAILETIRQTNVHPSAEWVYSQLKPKIPDLSLATVYRNMAAFLEDGTIATLGKVAGQERYDGNTEPHVHFICDRCGSVLDLDLPMNLETAAAVDREYGVRVSRQELMFRGLCSGCKEGA